VRRSPFMRLVCLSFSTHVNSFMVTENGNAVSVENRPDLYRESSPSLIARGMYVSITCLCQGSLLKPTHTSYHFVSIPDESEHSVESLSRCLKTSSFKLRIGVN
jgi:hypothetical protein